MTGETKLVIGGTAIAAIVAVGVVLFLLCSYQVGPGERGILLTWGNPDMTPKSEGLYFKIPIMQSVVIMDVKTLKYQTDLTAASKDLQEVKTTIAINYHILPEEVPRIYKEIGRDYAEKVIYPLEQEINKATTAQYTAEELITKRDEVRGKMKDALIEKLKTRNILVEEVSIINFEFSPSFTQAIEAKVVAEQSALAAKNKLEQVRFEADQRVAQATGEAEAIIVQSKALRDNPDILQLRWIEKWSGQLPTYVGCGGQGLLLNIPIQNTTS